MRLLVVELEGDGHCMVLYARLLLRECHLRGWSATLLTTESGRQHPAFEILASDPQGPPDTVVIPDTDGAGKTDSLGLMRSQIRIWKALRKVSRRQADFDGYDLIYCINMDKFEKALSVLGSPFGRRPLAGMVTNPKFHRAPLRLGPSSRADFLYRTLFKRLLRLSELRCVTVIDEPFREFCLASSMPGAEKIRAVPDVGELTGRSPAESTRRDLGIAETAFTVLLYGSLSRRKGVAELLRAIESIDNSDVVALIAGRADAEIEALLESARCRELKASGRLIVRNRFHDDSEEAGLFGAADAVWLGYVGGAYGSSGVLFQAGSAGLPVVAMELGLVGWMVREHDVGITVDPGDTDRVTRAIRSLRDDPGLRDRLGRNGVALARQHTGADFARSVCLALETATDEPPGRSIEHSSSSGGKGIESEGSRCG